MAVQSKKQAKVVWNLPIVGAVIVVNLPGETIRATVKSHIGPDTISVVLDQQFPIGKSHGYRKNEEVILERGRNMLGQTTWNAE